MNIFLSWSGETSKQLAKVFNEWLPSVLQSIHPYFSPNIKKGERWLADVSSELDRCTFGLLFLTKDNLKSEWIMFEAGALSKKLEHSRVSPLLFAINATDLKGPLVQFQATPFTKDEIQKLIETLNNCLGDQALQPKVLSDTFEMWWPKLEKKVDAIVNSKPSIPDRKIREDRELIEETLELVRGMASSHGTLKNRLTQIEQHTQMISGPQPIGIPSNSKAFHGSVKSLKDLKDVWPIFLEEVRRQYGITAAANLFESVPTVLTDTSATVTFPDDKQSEEAEEAADRYKYSELLNIFFTKPRLLKFDWDPFINE